MRMSQKLEQLLAFVCDEYESTSTVNKRGVLANILATKFTDRTGTRLGSVEARLDAFRLLSEQDWIEIFPRMKSAGATVVRLSSRIRPTFKGIEHVEDRRQSWLKRNWPSLLSALTEGAIKGMLK